MTDDTDDSPAADEVTKRIQQSADSIRLETQVKRGDSTRDEDRLKVKVRGDDPEETVAKLNQTLIELEDTPDALREMRATPDETEDDGDED